MRSMAVAAALLAPSVAAAQAIPEADEVAKKAQELATRVAEKQEDTLALAAELGTALTRGNTQTFHLHATLDLTWVFAPRWLSTSRAQGIYERTGLPDETGEIRERDTALNWMLRERVDRYLSERFGVFSTLALEQNRFAGLGLRSSAQLGVTYLVFATKSPEDKDLVADRLNVDLGVYGALEDNVVPPDAPPGTTISPEDENVTVGAARGAAAYVHRFDKGKEVGVDVELIQDFVDTSNTVVTATGYVAAAFIETLSLKLAVSYRFDNVPPETANKEDLLLTAGLLVNL